LIALSAVALSLAAFAPAASAGKLSTATKTGDVSGVAATGSVRVSCPNGTRAFAGGFQTSAAVIAAPVPPSTAPSAQNLLVVNESRRSGARGWRVTASQLGTGSGTLTAIVYCRAAKVQQGVMTAPLAGTGRSEATATAACPKGSFAVSGGYTLPVAGSQSQFVFATQDLLAGPRKWTVHGVRGSGQAPSDDTIAAYVYCGPKKLASSIADTQSAITAASNEPITVDVGPCPKGATSGGFKAPYTQNAATRETIFVGQSRLTKAGWRVSGQPFGTTGLQLNLSGFAYCK
jgi:hypothetical protein